MQNCIKMKFMALSLVNICHENMSSQYTFLNPKKFEWVQQSALKLHYKVQYKY